MEKDPVCGMLVNPEQAAGQRHHEAKTYYFCSPNCLAKFDQAPGRYAERVAEKEK
ncbi:MAG: YHS domain-containing protein [Pseudomonadota bacterium]